MCGINAAHAWPRWARSWAGGTGPGGCARRVLPSAAQLTRSPARWLAGWLLLRQFTCHSLLPCMRSGSTRLTGPPGQSPASLAHHRSPLTALVHRTHSLYWSKEKLITWPSQPNDPPALAPRLEHSTTSSALSRASSQTKHSIMLFAISEHGAAQTR